jgi:hypothetical protein
VPSISDQDHDFIELNRTFHELSAHAGKSDDVDLSQVFHVKRHLTWDDILKNPRTVILSEAGSGKTQEIRHIASRLRAEGKAAFFLRLELIPDDYEVAFEVGTVEEFNAWLASGDVAWLLLDSVDEARLRSPQDFERAVRRLGKLIDVAKGRVNIVLTGRTHAWRPKTDFDLCERHIGFPPQLKSSANGADSEGLEAQPEEGDEFDDTIETEEIESSDPKFKIVALDNLSREQVTTFASTKGVTDTSKFLGEIERVDAWQSTTRPQDLEDVIALWIDKGRIGTRLEIMKNSIDRRLMERDQQRAEAHPLSDERVREGAMLVAAAATLVQSQIIRVPDGADNTKGLPPRAILPDWADNDIAALLSRPIFDDAIYGTVRFHHRSVREYLTAVWLAKLLERPASRRAIESLLFKKQYGLDVVVPTMRPVLPWLVIFDEKIRERVRKIAPEVIFEGGDPSALPLPTRQDILAEICERIAQDSVVHSATEYAAVQRFAQPDIAEDISTLLRQYASRDSIVGFLVRMIWLGRLKSLLPEAKKVALSPNASRYTRIAAFRALREIGSQQDLEDVRHALVNESPRLSREWIGELITELAPTRETISWVLAATEKSEDKERYMVDRMVDAVTSFTEATRLEDLPLLLAGMGKLLDQTPVIERGYCEVSQRYSWVMKAAARAVERLIIARSRHALHPDSLEILHKFRAVREWGDDFRNIKVEFASLVPNWPELNDASLWHDVAATRRVVTRKKAARLTDYWQAQIFGAFWKFDATDFDRVCYWIQSRPEQDDKLVALTLAFAIYAQNGQRRVWREKLNSVCSGDVELETRLQQLLNPPPQQTQYKRQEQRWKRQAAARAKKQAEQFQKDKEYVQSHIELIRDPKFPNPADLSRLHWYLHEKVREKNSSSSRWTDGRWRELIPMFGEEVATAYRDGAMAYWRNYKPVLRSEGAEANSIPTKVIFGLTGLEIESRERPGGFLDFSQSDAELASRYALNELNGFPAWFPAFYAMHRDVVTKMLLDEIEYELSTGVPDHDSHYVLSDISWSAEWAWNDLAPSLFSALQKRDPKNASHLHQLLKVIQGSAIPDAEVAQLASGKVKGGNHDHLADWFAVWVGVDPDAAIPMLAQHLSNLNGDKERTDFAMRFVTKLWGGRRSETFGARSRFRTPQHLKSLYVLIHHYIRVKDDIDRAGGGVYSPGLRDDAQEGRNRVLQVLNEIAGKEAFLALEEIAAANRQSPSYPYLEMLCKKKAEQDADLQPWTPTNVREFHERLDRTPSTHRELADLAVLRLLDLKDDLEEGDDSVAAIIKAVTQETTLRNYIGHELRQKAFGRYSIPQEEELADAKKPDFRFHGVAIDAPVPTELKIADKWTGPALFERLENQLAGDYLRDIRSGRGVFALVYRGEKKSRWEIPGSRQSVDFDGLIEALRAHWAKIASKFSGVDEIAIIGIDLSKRGK